MGRAFHINSRKSNRDPSKGFIHGDRGWANHTLPYHRGVEAPQIRTPENQFLAGDSKQTSAAESLHIYVLYFEVVKQFLSHEDEFFACIANGLPQGKNP